MCSAQVCPYIHSICIFFLSLVGNSHSCLLIVNLWPLAKNAKLIIHKPQTLFPLLASSTIKITSVSSKVSIYIWKKRIIFCLLCTEESSLEPENVVRKIRFFLPNWNFWYFISQKQWEAIRWPFTLCSLNLCGIMTNLTSIGFPATDLMKITF